MEMVLEECWHDINMCIRCGFCREMVFPPMGTYGVCPLFERFGFESYTGRGKISIAKGMLEKKVNPSSRLAGRIYSCLLCKNCSKHCPNEVDVVKVVRAIREELVKTGYGPPENISKIESSIEKEKNVFGDQKEKKADMASNLGLPGKGDTLYFAGCYATYRYPETAKATVEILRKADINVSYLGEDEWCCGIVELQDGKRSLATELMEHNLGKIKQSGAKQVVTSCAGCFHALKSGYKEVLGDRPLDFEVLHISQVLDNLIKNGKIKLSKPIGASVTYHDPCKLGRYEGVFDEPRNSLKSIPAINLVEMKRNRENAWCCGGGTVVYANDFDLSLDIANERIEEAKEAGVDLIVTTCPLCMTVLRQSAKKTGAKVDIYDLPVLIAKSLS
jgi:Fe-S oxidoreductase